MTKEEFIKYLNELNIDINEDIYNKLDTYYELLIEWNNKFNLTSIIDKKDVFLLHFYDSICLTKLEEAIIINLMKHFKSFNQIKKSFSFFVFFIFSKMHIIV